MSATCGDGIVQAGVEDCDDGNDIDTDSCRSNCLPARCGDGVVQENVEACDDGNQDDADACKTDCTEAVCGDGIVQTGVETCDDGNQDDTDACRNDCTNARCGDGVVQTGVEGCDDGNIDETDACKNDCTVARCGDGIIQAGVEACDDGNANETDRCLNDCTQARCGDGIIRAGVEACDDGNQDDTDACKSDCTQARCGDGVTRVGVEQCDDANQNENDDCRNNCVRNVCGDGAQNPETEACDDGNTMTEECPYGEESCTVCAADCTIQPGQTHVCGDNVQDPEETCDDGNTMTETCEYGALDCVVCAADCTRQAGATNICGDNVRDLDNEGCDDGNVVTERCPYGQAQCIVCTETCQRGPGITSLCGDGSVDLPNGEQCDDGNRIDTDACTNACENARCGDGIVGPEEECDGGDECLNDCTLSARCGNGEVEDGEACDDGNQVDGDGCSRNCQPDAHCNIEGGKPEFDFVTLQPGTFRMGSARFDVSVPVHEVEVRAYQLMREEITVAEYRCCVNAGVCTPPECVADTISDGWQACNYALGREQHPVNFVTWHNAMDFARWTGHRLPSEAEWEYAARSGGKDQNHPWGNEPPTCELADHRFNRNGNCGDLGTSPGCSHPQAIPTKASVTWRVISTSGLPMNGTGILMEHRIPPSPGAE